VQTDVQITRPVNHDGVILMKDVNKVLCVCLANVIYNKIVEDKAEEDVMGFMYEQSRSVFGLDVPICFQVDA
jgi:hypothetical protein